MARWRWTSRPPRRASRSSFRRALGLDATAAAHGIIEIAVAKMSLAVRGVSVERGYDPRDFALVAMGGGGPLHALAIARDLHIPRVIIPNLPAHFSALGMLMTDVRHDFVQHLLSVASTTRTSASWGAFRASYASQGEAALDLAGAPRTRAPSSILWTCAMSGRSSTCKFRCRADELRARGCAAIRRRFDEVHERRFGHSAPHEPVELVNLRLTARGARPKIDFPADRARPPRRPASAIARSSSDPRAAETCPVYRRDLLSGRGWSWPARRDRGIRLDHDPVRGRPRTCRRDAGEIIVEVGSR